MGGRGSSSGAGGAKSALNARSAIDAANLTDRQIDVINQQRYDTWANARQYARENEEISTPNLTKTQRVAFDNMYIDNDYSQVDKASVKTLQAVKQAAEAKYDSETRRIARMDYDVRSDYTTNRAGKRVQTGEFPEAYAARQKAGKIANVVTQALENKGVRVTEREITSGTYKRALARNERQIQALRKGRR